MTYALANDVIIRSNLSATDGAKITAESLAAFIADAESEVDSYLSSKYTVPATSNGLLKRITVDLVLKRVNTILHNDLSELTAQVIETNYQQAIADLEKLRDGNITLSGQVQTALPIAVVAASKDDNKYEEGVAVW